MVKRLIATGYQSCLKERNKVSMKKSVISILIFLLICIMAALLFSKSEIDVKSTIDSKVITQIEIKNGANGNIQNITDRNMKSDIINIIEAASYTIALNHKSTDYLVNITFLSNDKIIMQLIILSNSEVEIDGHRYKVKDLNIDKLRDYMS